MEIKEMCDEINKMPTVLASIESRGADMKFGSCEHPISGDSTYPLERMASTEGSMEMVQEEEGEDEDDGTPTEIPLPKKRRIIKITVFNEMGRVVDVRIVAGEEEIVRVLGEDISPLYS